MKKTLPKLEYKFLLSKKVVVEKEVFIEATNEAEAEEMIKKSIVDDTEIKLIDKEVIFEEICGNCGQTIKYKIFESDFNKKLGAFFCPICGQLIVPCNECKDHDKCKDEECPYKKNKESYGKGITIIGNKDYLFDKIKKFLKPLMNILADGITLDISSHMKCLDENDFYREVYNTVCEYGDDPSYCNDYDEEKRSYRYASSLTLDNYIRIYCEWLIPSNYINEEEPEEFFCFNSDIFTLDNLDTLLVDMDFDEKFEKENKGDK